MRIAIVLAVLAVLAVGACGQQDTGPSLADIHAECRVGGRPFIETWTCERVGLSAMPGHEDIKALYVATGDYVVTQVQDGKMTDAEAKMAMAQARQQATTESGARYQREAAVRNARNAAAFSMLSANRPADPAPPAPMTFTPMRNPTVVCQRVGGGAIICN